jgi:catecholate siderophore receptor
MVMGSSFAGVAAGLALAIPAESADVESAASLAATVTLETIEVTGAGEQRLSSPKYTQSLKDTPQTIQVIDAGLFIQQGATTLTEALRNSAAVGTFYAGENGSTSTGDAISMRGFDTSSSIFADGIRDLGTISRDVFNMEAVEVMKGPAGADNGRGAPTGAINTVSKQATLRPAAAFTASGGADGQRRATVDWNHAIEAAGGSAMRVNAMWQDSAVPGRDHVNNQRWGVAPSLGFGLFGATRIRLNLFYVHQNNVPDGLVPTVGLAQWTPQTGLEQLVGHPVDSHNFYGTRDDHDIVTARMATLRVERDIAGTQLLTNTLRWGTTRQDYLLSSYTVTGGTASDPLAGNVRWTDAGDLSTYTLNRSNNNFRDQSNRIVTDQLNLRVDAVTGRIRHELSAGLEFISEAQVSHGISSNGTRPAANLYDPDWNDTGDFAWSRSGARSDGRTDTFAVYLFDTLQFGTHFLVTGGLRADRYVTRYEASAVCNDATGNGAVACSGEPVGTVVDVTQLAARDTLVNWKLGIVYKPVDRLSLYTNYALSQQPPGGANFQLSSSAASANNPDLKPQRAGTIEVGAKWTAEHQRLSASMALFETRVTNELNSRELDDDGNPTQTGEKRVRGLELSASGAITERWSLSAGLTHQHARVVAGPGVTQDGTSALAYTPEDSLTVWTSYRLARGLTVSGGLRMMDGLHRGTDRAAGTPLTTPGYKVLDAAFSWDASQSLALRLNVYNLANERYVAAINKSGYRYTPGAPRSLQFSAELHF